MQFPNLLPKWIAEKTSEPEGSAPRGLITKAGIVLGVALCGAVLLVAPPEEEAATEDEVVSEELSPPSGPEGPAEGERSIDEAAQLRQLEAERRQRDLEAEQQAAEQARLLRERWARERRGDAPAGAAEYAMGGAGGGDAELTPEQELYQSIRLAEIQRRHDSLRAFPGGAEPARQPRQPERGCLARGRDHPAARCGFPGAA